MKANSKKLTAVTELIVCMLIYLQVRLTHDLSLEQVYIEITLTFTKPLSDSLLRLS